MTIGYVLLNEDKHSSRKRSKYTKIVDMFVEESHRSQGYGSCVIGLLEERASERGTHYLEVSCEWKNVGARRFYDDNGFTEKQVTFVQDLTG